MNRRLIEKKWFTKVEAFEQFTNLWSFGRGASQMPMHNVYVPVNQTIMPRPKFRDYNKEDQEGKDFTYRAVNKHSVQPGILPQESLKPSPFSP